jgi:hypothetical protein
MKKLMRGLTLALAMSAAACGVGGGEPSDAVQSSTQEVILPIDIPPGCRLVMEMGKSCSAAIPVPQCPASGSMYWSELLSCGEGRYYGYRAVCCPWP